MFNITKYAIRNSAVIRLFMLIIVLGGIYAFVTLGKREDSTFVIKTAVVTCHYPGATPEAVEQLILEPMERTLWSINSVDEITSEAHYGYARLMVKLLPSTSPRKTNEAWDELRRKISDIRPELPTELAEITIVDNFGDIFGLYYALLGASGYSSDELRRYALDIERELYHIEGVERVVLSGIEPNEVRITIPRATLAMFDIRPEAIREAISSESDIISIGEIDSGELTITVSEQAPYTTIDNIKNQLFTAADGKQYRLGDIMRVELTESSPQSYIMRVDGVESIGIAIAANPRFDVVKVGAKVRAMLHNIEQRLPAGMELRSLYPEDQIAREATNDFIINLIESLAIVILLIIATMGWRSGVVVGGSLLLSIFATLIALMVTHDTLNRTSLAGFIIAMGMLVDNAIVVTDNSTQLMLRGMPRHIAVVKGATTPRLGLLAATLIAIISFLPLQLAPSSVAEIIKPLFIVIAISLLASWVLALTQVPEMNLTLQRALARGEASERSAWFRPIVEMLIRHRWVVLIVTLLLFALSLLSMSKMPQDFFPKLSKNMFRAEVILPTGYNIESTDQHLKSLTQWLLEQPEVKQVSTTAGGTPPRYYLASGHHQQQPEYGNLLIELHSAKECEEVERRLTEWAELTMPDIWLRTSQFKLSPMPDATIEVGFEGDNIDTLAQLTERTMHIMAEMEGVTNIRNSWGMRVPVYTPRYSQLKGQRIGVDREAMMLALEMATEGVAVGRIRQRDRELPIVLHTATADSGSLATLKSLPVFSARGRAYSIEQAAAGFDFGFRLPTIERIDGFRLMKAQCDPQLGINTIALVERLKGRLNEQLSLPDGYRMRLYGEEESRQESNDAIATYLPLTLILIVVILVMLFGNYRDPMIVLLTIPLIFIGVVLGLVISGKMFDFFSLLGLLGLVGMHVKSAVILLGRIGELRGEGYSAKEAAVRAASDRLSPVITAAGTTVLALIPLLFDAMFASMAATIMGGLVVATLLVVAILPVVYTIFYR